MRRAKSESAMIGPEIVHDVSIRGKAPTMVSPRPSSTRPSSARAQSRTLTNRTSSPAFSQRKYETRMRDDHSPPRAHYANPISPRARFAKPAVVEAQLPHGGFSYLFPSQPVVASVVPKRTVTPDHQYRQVVIEETFHLCS
ncbi:hypothetical protein KIN20_005836 [Parelaphostrongylus tenuis]|uniref:Uncharacterized protein n=1 Tax=Parelaphostrongylus tenuis TaxID=148309 RepID=A0AAD5M549_PARTN|nr:hypothetical protein KIN20_005836 [Parelaphostrongylus tenuis]